MTIRCRYFLQKRVFFAAGRVNLRIEEGGMCHLWAGREAARKGCGSWQFGNVEGGAEVSFFSFSEECFTFVLH